MAGPEQQAAIRHHQRRNWWSPVAIARSLIARPKLYVAVLVALATLLFGRALAPSLRGAAAWNTGSLTYIALSFYLMATCSKEAVRKRAARQDEGRLVLFAIVMLAVMSSFVAVIGLIAQAKNLAGAAKGLHLALAGTTIMESWLVMQLVFTFHYAHDYYRPPLGSEEATGGLRFPNDDAPDYWDFFYFTTSIGATSQTADVAITSKLFRRLVALQAVLSFVFNTTILALAINLAAGLL